MTDVYLAILSSPQEQDATYEKFMNTYSTVLQLLHADSRT
jgi:hypothetical protein